MFMKNELRDFAAVVKQGIEKRGYFLLMHGRLDQCGLNSEEEQSEFIRQVCRQLNVKIVPQDGSVLFVESSATDGDLQIFPDAADRCDSARPSRHSPACFFQPEAIEVPKPPHLIGNSPNHRTGHA